MKNVYVDMLQNYAFELTNKLGYGIFSEIFYEIPHQEKVIGYISVFKNVIYENAHSWSEVGYIGWDCRTIYENKNSWNIVGYIGFGCDDDQQLQLSLIGCFLSYLKSLLQPVKTGRRRELPKS